MRVQNFWILKNSAISTTGMWLLEDLENCALALTSLLIYAYSALNMLEQDEELENENNSQHTVETLEGGSIDIESLHELMESPKHGPSKGFPAGSGMQFARNR